MEVSILFIQQKYVYNSLTDAHGRRRSNIHVNASTRYTYIRIHVSYGCARREERELTVPGGDVGGSGGGRGVSDDGGNVEIGM